MRNWILERREVRLTGMVTQASARERTRRGAEYLDDVAPGWFDGVDLGSLNLADGNSCVLGQLHGSFAIGLGRSGLFSLSSAPRASFSPVDLGFHCVQGVRADLQDVDHSNLTAAWREEIRRRQLASGHALGSVDQETDVVDAAQRPTIDLPDAKSRTIDLSDAKIGMPRSDRVRKRAEVEAEV